MAGNILLKPINTSRNVAASKDEDVEEPLTPAARLFHVPKFNCCIVAIIGCKKKIDVEVMKEGLQHTLINHPRFSSKLVFNAKKGSEPVGWVRTPVTIDDHIIIPELDQNAVDAPDKFIEDYVTNLTKTPMDFSKPLWELHILNLKTTDADSVGVFRIHHSIGDGISLMSLVLACTRQSDNPEALPTLPVNQKRTPKPKGSFLLLRWFMSFLFILKLLWNTLVDVILFTATMVWLKDAQTPVKGGPGIEKSAKRIVYRTLSLDDIKLVKNAMDVTINDLLLGITQAGLSNYLNRKYGEAKGEVKVGNNYLPKHIRLRSTLLVNLRPTSTIKDLAEKMEMNSKGRWEWGNAIGYVLIPFHIALRDNPLDYIRDAKATIDKKKKSLEAPSTYAAAKMLLNTLGLRIMSNLTYRVLCNSTMSFSNVIGPKEEISFYGHPIVYLAPTVYGHPQALTVHYQSYMNKMTMVLAVDEDVIPDPRKLCDDVEECLKLAKKAVIDKDLSKC